MLCFLFYPAFDLQEKQNFIASVWWRCYSPMNDFIEKFSLSVIHMLHGKIIIKD